jgi:ADP-ribosyl-[dinitrogen reductase] hydrolase
LSNQNNFRSAIIATVQCGGDTDSVAAMVGGIVGAAVGKEGIPAEWLAKLWEPARSIEWMEHLSMQLGSSLQTGIAERAIRLPIFTSLLRNLFFLFVVLAHGFRRLLPPY